MAGQPSPGQAKVFSLPTFGGGGSTYERPSPISSAFLDTTQGGGAEGQEAASKKLRDVLTYAGYLKSEERADWQQKHLAMQDAIKIENERRDERRLDMELERKQRLDKMALHNEELEHRAGSLGSQLYMLDANRPDYPQKRDELLQDSQNHEALNSKFGKEVMENLKYQDARHNNMREWFSSKSEESGYQGGFYDPSHRDKDGNLDFKKLNDTFTKSAQQKAIDAQSAGAEQEYQMQQQGMVKKRVSYDPATGKQKFEYVPKTQIGVKELTRDAKALDADFKRDFGSHNQDLLEYPIGYKDARGYTITRGKLQDGKKFVEDPTGDAVKIHDALHAKADKVVGMDTFNQYKKNYHDIKQRAQDIRDQYPGMLEKESEGQATKPSKATAAQYDESTATGRLQKKRAEQAETQQKSRNIADAEQEIKRVESRIASNQDRLNKGLLGDDETEASVQSLIEEDQAALEDGKKMLEQYKTGKTPLSEQSGGITDELFPPKK